MWDTHFPGTEFCVYCGKWRTKNHFEDKWGHSCKTCDVCRTRKNKANKKSFEKKKAKFSARN